MGRGAWVGPVVAGAFVVPTDVDLYDMHSDRCLPQWLRDSKTLTHQQRLATADLLKRLTDQWSIGQASVEEIDQLGIRVATFKAMERAVKNLAGSVDYLLVDGAPHPGWPLEQQLAMAKGDAKSASIAAASIMAKVYRDQLMDQLAMQYPVYGFERHKGYGTADHQTAIAQYGLSAVHRKRFKIPV